MVCSDHFHECVIKREGVRVTLKQGALPTRFKSRSNPLHLNYVDPLTGYLHDHTYYKKENDNTEEKSDDDDGNEVENVCEVDNDDVKIDDYDAGQLDIVECKNGDMVLHGSPVSYLDEVEVETEEVYGNEELSVEDECVLSEEPSEQGVSVVRDLGEVDGEVDSVVVLTPTVDVDKDDVVYYEESVVKNTQLVMQKGHRNISMIFHQYKDFLSSISFSIN